MCRRGPLSAADLAAGMGVARTRAYRILDALVQRQWAAATLSRPQRFEPADPAEVLDVAIEDCRRRLKDAEQLRAEVLPLLHEVTAQGGHTPAPERFRLIEGAPRVRTALARLASNAKAEVAVTSLRARETAAPSSSFDDLSLIAASRRENVAVRALVSQAADALDAGDGSIELRRRPADRSIRFALVDSREILVVVAEEGRRGDPWGREVALWTDSPALVAIHRTLFDELWQSETAPHRRAP